MGGKSSERRDSFRIPVSIPVDIFRATRPKEKISGEVTDISLGGAFIETPVKIEPNEEIQIEIRFNETKIFHARITGSLKEMSVEGTETSIVRWTRDEEEKKVGFGVEFSNLQIDKRRFLEKLLDYYQNLAKAGVTFKN